MTEKSHTQINRATPLMPWLDRYGACKDDKNAAQKADWATLGEAWNQCPDVGWLLRALVRTDYSDEPVLRLFACRCVRETPLVGAGVVGDHLTDPRSWAAVETAERFARNQASAEELAAAREAVMDAAWDEEWGAAWEAAWRVTEVAAWNAVEKTAWATQSAVAEVAEEAANKAIRKRAQPAVWEAYVNAGNAARAAAAKFQADLLRQMIDPFRA